MFQYGISAMHTWTVQKCHLPIESHKDLLSVTEKEYFALSGNIKKHFELKQT